MGDAVSLRTLVVLARAEYETRKSSPSSSVTVTAPLWSLNPKNYIHLSGKDAKNGDTYRGHPTQVVAAVSGAMGHNRLEIVFSHYNYTD